MVILISRQVDFGTMRRYEEKLKTEKEQLAVGAEETRVTGHGGVIDLVLPIVVLIVLCIAAMLYTGGILEGKGIQQAFADCDSSLSLVIGSFFTLVFTFLLYLPRKILSFSEFCDSFVKGSSL